MELSPGANLPLTADVQVLEFRMDRHPPIMDVDLSAYVLGADGKVSGDADIVFYGQPLYGHDVVTLDVTTSTFRVDLARLSPQVQRIVFCAVVDGGSAELLNAITVTTKEGVSYRHSTRNETLPALILCEIYRRADSWKIRAVGQGFAGGMEPLARSYGVDVEPSTPEPSPGLVDLRKNRLVDLQKRDANLAAVAETARVSLSKRGLSGLTAKICLATDISASMRDRYLRGSVDALVTRCLGLALNIDDDGAIDTCAFGANAHWLGEETTDTYRTFTSRLMKRTGLEPNTYYGKMMRMIRDHYRSQPDFGRVPVYVMFLTDGGTNDPRLTETQIVEASREGIFWQFMAVGELPRGLKRGRSTLPKGFDFLAMLDTMPGRLVDNANFFAVEEPDALSDADLYDLMMAEYPEWLEKAKAAGVLR
ncbi:VWA domain-containing protein [Sphingomonas sp. 3-13AW]|uniref:VWA domain-containing protein n=1 Tax=Sphingomonas sp. 3-13AW TaxID=3050450 RepID=UPI003BB79466